MAYQQIWRDILDHLASRKDPQFTAADLAEELDLTYPSAGQILGRLRKWGHIKLVAFDDPARTKANPGGRGRRRLVYEVTPHGKRSSEWHRKKGAR